MLGGREGREEAGCKPQQFFHFLRVYGVENIQKMVLDISNQVLAEGSSTEGKQPQCEVLCEAPDGIES